MVALDARSRPRRRDRRHRQRRRHAGRARPGPGARDDRLAHRHRAHRRPLRRQPRRAGRPRGGRDARPRRRHHAPTARRRFFTDEEGARFPPDMLGSLVYVGGLALEEALDIRRHRRQSRRATSWSASATRDRMPCPGPAPHAYVELHIEQGPVLEARGHHDRCGRRACRASRGPRSTITGQSNHAGTTPMALRHDAGYAAAEVVTFVRAWLAPSSAGAPGRHRRPARAAPEPRQRGRRRGHAHRRPAQHRRARARGGRAARRRRSSRSWPSARASSITIAGLARFEPVAFDRARGRPRRAHGAAARAVHDARMPSGAGHDAQMLARLAPDRRWCSCPAAAASATTPPSTPTRRPRRRRQRAAPDVLTGPRRRRGGPGMTRIVTVGAAQLGPIAARRTRARRSWSGSSRSCTRRTAGLRARRVPRARAHHVLPSLVHPTTRTTSTPGSSGRCRRPRRSHCSTRRRGSASASASGSPSSRPTAITTTARSLVERDGRGGRPATARCTSPATRSTSRGGRSSTSRALLRPRPRRASACGAAFGGIVGMMICNDRRWPESYRVMGLQGVELILCGYNTPIHYAPDPSQDILQGFHNDARDAGGRLPERHVGGRRGQGRRGGGRRVARPELRSSPRPARSWPRRPRPATSWSWLAATSTGAPAYKGTLFDFERYRRPSSTRGSRPSGAPRLSPPDSTS